MKDKLPPQEQDLLNAYEAIERERMDLVRTSRDQRDQLPQALRISVDQTDNKLSALFELLIEKGILTRQECLEAMITGAADDVAELKRRLLG